MDAIEFLKSIFDVYQIEVSDIQDDRIIVSLRDCKYFISIDEIKTYQAYSEQIINDPETAIYYPGHYEHYIQIAESLSTRFLANRRGDIKLEAPDESIKIDISDPSSNFLFSIFQNGKKELRRYLMHPFGREQNDPKPWTEMLRGFKTVKVQVDKDSKFYTDKNKMKQIAEAGLFHIAFGNSICYNLALKFERDHYFLGRRREEVQFPRRTYTSDLLSYYNLALSSDSLMLGYIALYKILEYFFPSATENALHKRMTDKLVSPDFTHTKPKQLRDLAKVIRQFDQRMDEQRMLSTVIETFFTSNELIDWVAEYEAIEEKYYSIPKKVLGETFTLDLNPEKIASSLAKRIYHIRNVLVHNKEDEPYRFIPFSGEESALTKEIPIVMFLAEQLIIKTGKDL